MALAYENQETDFVIEDGVLTQYAGNAKEVIIPETVTAIAGYAFNECIDLTSVAIPESVTEINSYAFNNCINLTDIFISKSVEELNRETFNGCVNITNIEIEGEILIDYHNDIDAPVLPADINTNKFLVMNRILQFLQREFNDGRELYINGVNIFDTQNMKEMQEKRAKSKQRRKITAPIGVSLGAIGAITAFIGLFMRINSGGNLMIFIIGMVIFVAGCIFMAVN